LRRWHAENDEKLAKLPPQESVSYRMADFDDIRPHLANFFDAVRSRKPAVEDVVFGHHAALACHMANESYFRGSAVTWDAASRAMKG
ncbi:MAG: gfo/Idh/MocA family oxidoreductase, partial [Gemmatimonadaceae bacterium]